MEDRQVNISIDSDVETRKGVHSNIVLLTTEGPVTKIDFLNADISVEEDEVRAALSSRVYMSNEDLVALRDMLIRHTASWKVAADGPEG